jgi:hypothetical protein
MCVMYIIMYVWYINRTVACVCSDKLLIQANIGHSELFKLVICLHQIAS